MIKIALLTPLTVLLATLIIWLIIRSISITVSDIFLFFIFLFAYANIDKALATFYLIGLLFVIVVDWTNQPFELGIAKKFSISKFTFKGYGFMIFSLILGFFIYIGINMMGTRTGSVVIGVPILATVTTSTIVTSFMPALTALLGIIENRVFFTLFNLVTRYGVLIPVVGVAFGIGLPVLPILLSSLIFALFHLTAYSIAVGAILWAMMSFALFLSSYLITGDTLSADFAHWLNNALVAIKRGLQIVT